MTSADVPRGTSERLADLEAQVCAEASNQNMVSAATLPDFRHRHIDDSLQLLPLAPASGRWLDIGTGAGFPGLAVALAAPAYEFVLVEPRALRAAFLQRMTDRYALGQRVAIFQARVERLTAPPFDIITARAVASLERLFEMAGHLATRRTIWLLPKGRTAEAELAVARATWQGEFRLVPSITDPEASIIVATDVKRRMKR